MPTKSRNRIRPHQSTLLFAAFATLLGFLVPIVQQLLLPLQYLNTHLHEFSHALVAIATGASVERIVVNANGSGYTPVAGGSILLIASAGYVGASVFGAAMIYAGRTEKGAKAMLWTLTGILLFSLVVWVRGDSIGEVAGIGWAIVLGIMALTVKGKAAIFCTQFLGLQQCLNSVRSLFVLVQLSVGTDVHSDATILHNTTGVPPIFWAVGWSGFSLLLVAWSLRKSWSPVSARA